MDIAFGLCSEGLSAHQSRERIVGCGRAGGELSVRGRLCEFQQDIAPWTGDALRIGKVFMHHPVKCVKQFFFRIHSAHPS